MHAKITVSNFLLGSVLYWLIAHDLPFKNCQVSEFYTQGAVVSLVQRSAIFDMTAEVLRRICLFVLRGDYLDERPHR